MVINVLALYIVFGYHYTGKIIAPVHYVPSSAILYAANKTLDTRKVDDLIWLECAIIRSQTVRVRRRQSRALLDLGKKKYLRLRTFILR